MAKDDLSKLARLYGVQTCYCDMEGRIRYAPRQSLIAALRELGAPLDGRQDAREAIRRRRGAIWQSVLEPLVVAWQGKPAEAPLRLPASIAGGSFQCCLLLEGGLHRQWSGQLHDLPTRRSTTVEGVDYLRKSLPLPPDLPQGYHQLEAELAGKTFRTLVLSAPQKAYWREDLERRWGLFLPLHALRRSSSWSAGDFSDLEAFMAWTARQGGRIVGTLPFLAQLWELGHGPGPYSPASRLFFDEFYLDVTKVSGFEHCRKARDLLESPAAHESLQKMRQGDLVDYSAQAKLKHEVLAALAEQFFSGQVNRCEFEQFRARCPEAERFALFRAVGCCQGKPWPKWPAPLRDGQVGLEDCRGDAFQFHLFVQWQLERQVEYLSRRARELGLAWYLDQPLGCERASYDTWRYRDSFCAGVSVGAPPDKFFSEGQNWGFAPMQPHRMRQLGYNYFIASLRSQLCLAGMLRIDHVMALARLYWIPSGAKASEGVYVRYPLDEMMAILAMESHRHKAVIVGENLGTVSMSLNRALERHGILGMYVLPFEICPGEALPLCPVPRDSVACLNTHDMPTFAAHWQGRDIDQRRQAGLLDDDQARRERNHREQFRQTLLKVLAKQGLDADGQDLRKLLEACLCLLGRSPARLVLVNLEDLWLEDRRQNVPGVGGLANWRTKARLSLEEFSRDKDVQALLAALNELRR